MDFLFSQFSTIEIFILDKYMYHKPFKYRLGDKNFFSVSFSRSNRGLNFCEHLIFDVILGLFLASVLLNFCIILRSVCTNCFQFFR